MYLVSRPIDFNFFNVISPILYYFKIIFQIYILNTDCDIYNSQE